MKMIHVVFITDDNYATATAVAIKSIQETTNNRVDVRVICDNVENNKIDMLRRLGDDEVQVKIYENNKKEYKKFKIDRLHVSTSALIKFDLPNLLSDLDKVLYIDGDVLIKRDLTELYETDVQECYAGVVKDYKPMTYKPSQVDKLNIKHSAYFNTGVMLLNLKRMRTDCVTDKLFKYRENGLNYFMDQDAFNVVFKENVKYLDFKFNLISTTIGAFDIKDLVKYYGLDNLKDKNELYNNAVIIHLTGRYKPWEYVNVPFSSEWRSNYRKLSKGKAEIGKKIIGIDERNKIYKGIRVKVSPAYFGIENKVNVSLTSFPERIDGVYQTVRSIQKQTIRVDRIVLWLSVSQFKSAQKNIPDSLLKLVSNQFEIKWVDEDIGPHKKYFYTMKEYPEDIVITFDDDVWYRNDTVERLLISYIKYPYAVSANRVHLMTIGDNGKLKEYADWERSYIKSNIPSHQMFATGVGGVLYPPACFKQLISKQNIIETCLYGDDLILKHLELSNNVPVVWTGMKFPLKFIDGSQETALWKVNHKDNRNDLYIKQIIDKFDGNRNYIDLIVKSSLRDRLCDCLCFDDGMKKITNENKQLKEKIKFLKNTTSYKIGRVITWIPRKLINKFKTK